MKNVGILDLYSDHLIKFLGQTIVFHSKTSNQYYHSSKRLPPLLELARGEIQYEREQKNHDI